MASVPTLAFDVDFTGHHTATFDDILQNADGVVSYWRMNSTSTFLDSVGDNDGVIVGTPSTTAGAHTIDTDLALAFDGSADGAYVPSSINLTQVGDFSLEAWVKLPSLPGATRDLIAKRGSWLLQVNSSGKLIFTVKDDTSTASVTSSAALATSTYYHVVCVYDSTNILLYINGLLDVSTAYSAGREAGTQPVRFALTPGTASPTWQSEQHAEGSSTSVTCNTPASTGSGDYLLAHISISALQTITAVPSGWTIIGHETSDDSPRINTYLYEKIATGSEPGSYTWTTSGSTGWVVAISRITGQDGITPRANIVYGTHLDNAHIISTGSHLPATDNTLIFALYAYAGSGVSWTESSGTERYDFGTATGAVRLAMSSQTQASAASIAVTGTNTGADVGVSAFMVIVAGAGNSFIAATVDDAGFWDEALDPITVGIHYTSRLAGAGSYSSIVTDVGFAEIGSAKRQYEFDRMEAGTSQVTLRDANRNYDPGNTSASHYPYLIPMRKARAQGTWSAVTYPLCIQFVERWPIHDFTSDYEEVDITLVDGFDFLALAGISGTLAAGFSGAQINALLDKALWPISARSIDTGQYALAAQTIATGATALSLILEIADSEQGIFFIDASGVATFHDAAHRGSDSRSTTSQATFCDHDAGGGIFYQDLSPSFDKDRLTNDWTVTPDSAVFGSASQQVVDYTSILKYGRRSQTRSTKLGSNDDALSQANNLLNQTSAPALRFDTMVVLPTTSAGYTSCLDLRISDRVTVKRGTSPTWNGASITKDCFVEAKTIVVSENNPWIFTFQLSPVSSGNYYDTIVRDAPISYWRMDAIT